MKKKKRKRKKEKKKMKSISKKKKKKKREEKKNKEIRKPAKVLVTATVLCISAATPKSASLATPLSDNITFAAFTSRCILPLE